MARRRRRLLRAVPIALSLGLSGLSVWVTSAVAFSDQGSDEPSAPGPSVLQVDGLTSAAFDVGGLSPGESGERCLVVSADQPDRGSVRMYVTGAAPTGAAPSGAAPAGGLADYLRLTIDVGTGGSLASCDGFVGSTVASGTLAATLATHRDFDSGVGAWLPTASSRTRTYRVTYTLDRSAPSSVGGMVTEATFVWECRPTS